MDSGDMKGGPGETFTDGRGADQTFLCVDVAIIS